MTRVSTCTPGALSTIDGQPLVSPGLYFVGVTCPLCGCSSRFVCPTCGTETGGYFRTPLGEVLRCPIDESTIFESPFRSNSFGATPITCPQCKQRFVFGASGTIQSVPEGLDPVEVRRQRIAQQEAACYERYRSMSEEFASQVRSWLQGELIIDTNVWMCPTYDDFFRALSEVLISQRGVVRIAHSQFDEMCNIKRDSEYGTDKSNAARRGLGRVESLQASGVLAVDGLGPDTDRNAYADSSIVAGVITSLASGKSVTIFTDDVELRIRVRQVCSEQLERLRVVDAAESRDLAQG